MSFLLQSQHYLRNNILFRYSKARLRYCYSETIKLESACNLHQIEAFKLIKQFPAVPQSYIRPVSVAIVYCLGIHIRTSMLRLLAYCFLMIEISNQNCILKLQWIERRFVFLLPKQKTLISISSKRMTGIAICIRKRFNIIYISTVELKHARD